ncbi:outer membrane protein with beta-barrel domain [Gillisia mitskevichiae]|uniref:Outer membrane protein with beta-barrel domain n=1 Tax=Gillisia mitskevichiae TaxID=270921 RepID=A0A495PSL4_9FLAO|nr:porin family protein [Gillisia mitskevichiae]RKS53511.1 outer membrane protein with beta-barrel domain [Gillisia mitskevichiae]
MKAIRLSVILCLFFLTLSVHAQSSKLDFGLKAGANYSKFTPNPQFYNIELGKYKGKVGYYVGGFLNIEVSEKLQFQPELLIAMQGTRLLIEGIETQDPGNSPVVSDFRSKVNDLTIVLPLEVRYFFTQEFFAEAGPQIGYIVDRTYKTETEVLNDNFPNEREDPNNPNNFDYDKFEIGLNLGTGYNLSEKLTISARYFFGLNERDNNLKSSVINLGLEFKL